jgi:hypothetical protein
MKSVEERQAELRRIDLWLQQHPTQSNLIALATGLFFGVFSLALDSAPGPALQLFTCILAVLLWFETIVLILPER